MAFSTVVAFNRFPERASIHTVAFHRLALVGHGNNLGGFSQYDPLAAEWWQTVRRPRSLRRTNEHAFWMLEADDEICFHGKN